MRVDRSSVESCVVITTRGTAPLTTGHSHDEAADSGTGRRVAEGLLTMPGEHHLDVHDEEYERAPPRRPRLSRAGAAASR